MPERRRRFSPQFKAEAVQMVFRPTRIRCVLEPTRVRQRGGYVGDAYLSGEGSAAESGIELDVCVFGAAALGEPHCHRH